MKKRMIPLLLVFCLLAIGSLTPADVFAESAETPVTTVTDASGALEWTFISPDDNKPDFSYMETIGDITIGTNWGSGYIAVMDADLQPIATYTGEELMSKLGREIENKRQSVSLSKLFVMDDAFYIMYSIWETYNGGGSAVEGGLIRTKDCVTFENLVLPVKDVTDRSYSIEKFNDTYILMNLSEYAAPQKDNTFIYTYYISNDLETWTECQSPEFLGEEYTRVSFRIATITEKGVYFKADIYMPGESYDAIYFTDDFKNYTCITKNIYRGDFYVAPSRAELPGNTLAILAFPNIFTDIYYDKYDLYLYNEDTGELTHILRTEDVWDHFIYNFKEVDPLTLYVEPYDGNEHPNYFIAYSASSQDPSATVKYAIPYSWSELTREHKWWDWEFDGKIYSFDSLFMTDGTQAYMLVSSDYWETAYRFDIGTESAIPSKVNSVSHAYATEDSDATMVLVCDNGTYTCSLKDVTSYLTPLTTLKDEETGVSVISSTNGALPEGTELAVKLVSDDHGTVVYDINLLKDKTAVQPIYPVYVKIPIPAEKIDVSYNVYRVETDGTKTTMKAETVDDCIRFATDHFSQYVIEWANATPPAAGDDPGESENSPAPSEPPAAGDDQGSALPFVVLLSGAVSIVLFVGLRKSRKLTEIR